LAGPLQCRRMALRFVVLTHRTRGFRHQGPKAGVIDGLGDEGQLLVQDGQLISSADQALPGIVEAPLNG